MLQGKELGKAIKEVIEKKGVTQKDVAEMFNIKPPSVSSWIDTGRISKNNLSKFINWASDVVGADFFGIDYVIDYPPSSNVAESEDLGKNNEDYTSVSVYDVKLSAGNGNNACWIVRDSSDPLVFRKKWFKAKDLTPEYCKALYVRGDSMEPELKNKDTVLIDTSDTEVADGDIYAVAFKGRLFIKQIVIGKESINLVSLNKNYEPIVIEQAELKDLKILGKKVWRAG